MMPAARLFSIGRRQLLACWLLPACAAVGGVAAAVEVNPSSRTASLGFYRTQYLPSNGVPIAWTGSHSACDAGSTSLAFRQAVINRVNYFRAMAGVPGNVVLDDALSAPAQEAALMMSANQNLSHAPPMDWLCYTAAGAAAAGKSNLALGVNGAAAVNTYMQDPGAPNYAAAHRRWLLYPQTDEMGTGDVPRVNPYLASNALWVIDGDSASSPRPATREPYVAWPPPGFVPYTVTFARWSFSYPDADFSAASVAMTEAGAAITTRLETIVDDFGEDTLVWVPKGLGDSAAWARPSFDTVYDVAVSNVSIDGTLRTFNYRVTVFDPAVMLADFDSNGMVNGADLTRWRSNFGATGATVSQGDADRDSDVDGNDLLLWQREAVAGLTASGQPVPEPASAAIAALGAVLAVRVRRRSRFWSRDGRS
jgi:uncharacterized protein YkwD